MIDAKYHDSFWRRAANAFNKADDNAIDFNLLQGESHTDEVKALQCDGYVVTPSKLEVEF